MTTNDTGTRVTIARNGDGTYFLSIETLPDASEDIFVTADLTHEDVKTIAAWANPPKEAPRSYPLVSVVHAGLIQLSRYANNVISVSASNWVSSVSWRLTETSSRELIEEAGRWTR